MSDISQHPVASLHLLIPGAKAHTTRRLRGRCRVWIQGGSSTEGNTGRHLVARRSAALLAARMHRWLVSCLRMANLKLSADWPLVPRSRANGGRKEGGGTMHTMPHRSPWSGKQQGLLAESGASFNDAEACSWHTH
jgi:hypothetical protein